MKLYDIVKWDPEGPDAKEILVYKHEAEDFNTHTQLIVHSSQEAILYKDGIDLDVFDAGRHTLSTNNIPLLRKLVNIPTGGESPFHCEVYFINKIHLQDLKWGTTEPILVEDPIENVNVHLRANGYIGATITDGRKFMRKVVGTRGAYTRTEFADYLRAKLIERVKGTLGEVLVAKKIGVLNISALMTPLSDELKAQMTPFFADYGIELVNFSFNSIMPLEEDLRMVNEAKIAAKRADLESAARARMREREGYTYQQEHSFDVLKTAAKNEGMAGSMMGTGMGLGMGFGIGGAFGAGMGTMGQQIDVSNTQRPKTVACSNCGNPVAEGAKFCPNCGKPVPAPGTILCPKCSAVLPEGAKFCSNCGAKLSNTCVKCGKELPVGAKFCDGCGAPQM